eukprot:1029789-Prymnesium_polylepis.1
MERSTQLKPSPVELGARLLRGVTYENEVRPFWRRRCPREGGGSVAESADWRRSLEFDDVSSLQLAGLRAASQSGAAATLPGPAAERAA